MNGILTLTCLSHPHETIIGLAVFGENLTQDTQSLWPSSCRLVNLKDYFIYLPF